MIYAIVSQKGGVGKTSLVQNVGAELAAAGRDTLLIDFDSQANLTQGWGLDPGEDRPTIYDALLNPARAAGAVISLRPRLDLIPANLDLAGAELQFAADFDRNGKLKAAIKGIVHRYTHVLIDTPPTLSFLTSNALIAAQRVIIPLQCQFYALKALAPVFDIVQRAAQVNEGLQVYTIVPTMYDSRNSLSGPVVDAARAEYADLVSRTVIPVNVRIADAPIHGLPVREHDELSTGASAYQQLVEELFTNGDK
jgi:chromosome partitioning protein